MSIKSSHLAIKLREGARLARVFLGGAIRYPTAPPAEIAAAARQLARYADPAFCGTYSSFLHYHTELRGFALIAPTTAAEMGGWEPVEWDGYEQKESL